VVLSYDVLEHVEDPRVSVAEIRRVLRPGGLAFLVFPPYLGAFSHHLNYVTLLPGLHWVFSPSTLISAVNWILDRYPDRFGTLPQPTPGRSFDGARHVLPALNGLGSSHLSALFDAFDQLDIGRRGYLRRIGPPSRSMQLIAWAPAWLQDALTYSLSCVLRKPPGPTPS
jgi:SAM-dependent methyltransferase